MQTCREERLTKNSRSGRKAPNCSESQAGSIPPRCCALDATRAVVLFSCVIGIRSKRLSEGKDTLRERETVQETVQESIGTRYHLRRCLMQDSFGQSIRTDVRDCFFQRLSWCTIAHLRQHCPRSWQAPLCSNVFPRRPCLSPHRSYHRMSSVDPGHPRRATPCPRISLRRERHLNRIQLGESPRALEQRGYFFCLDPVLFETVFRPFSPSPIISSFSRNAPWTC